MVPGSSADALRNPEYCGEGGMPQPGRLEIASLAGAAVIGERSRATLRNNVRIVEGFLFGDLTTGLSVK